MTKQYIIKLSLPGEPPQYYFTEQNSRTQAEMFFLNWTVEKKVNPAFFPHMSIVYRELVFEERTLPNWERETRHRIVELPNEDPEPFEGDPDSFEEEY